MHKELPDKIYIQLPHTKQRYNWDCGVACVLMVLPKHHQQALAKNLLSISKDEGFYKRFVLFTETIRGGARIFTVTVGIDPGYHTNTFYNHIIVKDEERIRRRFNDANKNGIMVHNRSLMMSSILRHLVRGPAIMLINAKLLVCDTCKTNKLSMEFRQCIPWSTSYQGHYIILCGYNLHRRKIYYRNPSLTNRVCITSIDRLEDAWRSYGTDDDLILIYP
ncbi:hypothetical protein FQR65_LT00199 [Abscondita terminalis]|nr:hypothetical protein FQR65_LT00199 [Abscondita terminalis]